MWYCSIIYLFVLLLIRLWLRANCIYPESHIRNALPESTLARLILLVNLDEAGVCTIIHNFKSYISVIPWCLCVVPQRQIISRYGVMYCYVIILNNLACWCVCVMGT